MHCWRQKMLACSVAALIRSVFAGQRLRWRCVECIDYFKSREKAKKRY